MTSRSGHAFEQGDGEAARDAANPVSFHRAARPWPHPGDHDALMLVLIRLSVSLVGTAPRVHWRIGVPDGKPT